MIGAESGAMPGLIAPPSDDQITSSGTDYGQRRSSPPAAAAKDAERDSRRQDLPNRRGPSADSGPAPGSQRLRARDALLACLEAIARQHGQGPIEVQTVDYARYRRRARARGAVHRRRRRVWAWAVGPDCGTRGVGADRLVTLPG